LVPSLNGPRRGPKMHDREFIKKGDGQGDEDTKKGG